VINLKIKINNKEVTFKAGETLFQVAKKAGYFIPTMCHMEGCKPTGACRVCIVEDAKSHRLIASCSFPAEDGMEILTDSPAIRTSRKTIIELMLANHPQDCLTCDKSGNCTLQSLAKQYGISKVSYKGEMKLDRIDKASFSVERDFAKCVLCGKCVTVCAEKQGVSAIDFAYRGFNTQIKPGNRCSLAEGNCVGCGQCIMVCPVGALKEISHKERVWDAINNKKKRVVVQIAPACQITFPEFFKKNISVDEATKKVVGALKRIGVDIVIDTNTAADITIVEEAKEFVERLTKKNPKPLPMFTSCCPGWINFIEAFYPNMTDHLSSCKSPHMMEGALVKRLSKEVLNIEPKDVYMVSIMPCTAKKYECNRPELENDGMKNVDSVLTTRELFVMLNEFGIQFEQVEGVEFDVPFSKATGAARIFGASGGVMEAALRTAYFYVTGQELPESAVNFEDVRGISSNVKRATVDVAGTKVNVGVVNGLGNVVEVIEDIINGKNDLHFIEVMTCQSGCIGGGGQPFETDIELLKSRMKKTYKTDENSKLRKSHLNPEVKALYDKYIKEDMAHEYLHTTYKKDKGGK